MAIQEGHAETQAQGSDHGREDELGAGIPASDALTVHASGLTLVEAEDIAARRLHDLAIRLNTEESEEAADEPGAQRDAAPPFDADRHFRARLAKRIADLSNDNSASLDEVPETEPHEESEASEDSTHVPVLLPPPYAVSEARLDDFGERFSTLLRSASLQSPSHAPYALELASEHPSLDSETEEPAAAEGDGERRSLTQAIADSAAVEPTGNEPVDMLAPAVRLVDLIREQRTLLDRLADLSLSHDAIADDKPVEHSDAGPDATVLLHADASAEAADAGHDGTDTGHDEDDPSHPVTISAEELIAALKTTMPVRYEEPEPALSELQIRQREDDGADALDMHHEATPSPADHTSERPPMIIERARAERSALETSVAIRPAPAPSGAVGFIAGLSLSMVIGTILYVVLQA
jgi:hypothetical protein